MGRRASGRSMASTLVGDAHESEENGGRYTLDGKSRYCLDASEVQDLLKKSSSSAMITSVDAADGLKVRSQQPFSAASIAAEADDIFGKDDEDEYEDDDFSTENAAAGAFAKTVSLAMALAKERKKELGEGADGRGGKECAVDSFRQFLLLSVDPESDIAMLAESDGLTQEGSRFLDPFCFKVADILDTFPSSEQSTNGEGDSSFDMAALSPFCFPNGVRVRLLPRGGLDGAKRMGWLGNGVDKFHPLVFTDGSGVTSHGVSITVQEEVNCSSLVKTLMTCRDRRQAALKLTRWWKKCVEKARALAQSKRRFSRGGMSFEPPGGVLKPPEDGDRSDNESVTSRGSIFSFRSRTVQRNNSFSSLSDFLGGGQKAKASKKKREKKKRGTAKSGESLGVSDILDEFLRSSPIPKYDNKVQTGVWRSAKLRVSKKTNQCMVVIRHAPLKGATGGPDGGPFDYTSHFEEERARLIEMLKDAPVPLPGKDEESKSKSLCVTSICFEELDEVTGKKKKRTTETNAKPREEDPEPNMSQQRAVEAYDTMCLSEKLGEACVVEKCYVLMGGKSREQSLLLAALSQLVDVERKDHATRNDYLYRTVKDAILKLSDTRISEANEIIEEEARHVVEQCKKEISRRHKFLASIQREAKLSPMQATVAFPATELGHVFGKREFIEMNLHLRDAPRIRLPLPLPQIAGEWGLAKLLLKVGANELMKVLKLLLLERSVLVLGVSSEEVTSCTCTLLELLRPYEWASTFLPLLPTSMLDFLHSPVPFVAGMAVAGDKEMKRIETDYRVEEALADGMCVVNLTKGTVLMKMMCGEDQMLTVPPNLSHALDSLEKRMKSLVRDRKFSFGSIQDFVLRGLTPKESVTVNSVQKYILRYMTKLAGDLATDKDAWKRYGKFNEYTNGYDFYPALFLNPLRAELQFLEEMAHTQLFVGFVDARRKNELKDKELHQKAAGKRIADWVHEKWIEREISKNVVKMHSGSR